MSKPASPINFHVAVDGNDRNAGTEAEPLASLSAARNAVRTLDRPLAAPVRVIVHEGTYYFTETLVLTAADAGSEPAPIVYQAAKGERVTVSGGRRLECSWEPYRDGIMCCCLPDVRNGELDFTQLFVNGKRQVLARYPNRDDSDPENYSGYTRPAGAIAADVVDPCPMQDADMTFSREAPRGIEIAPDRFTERHWSKPEEAVIHIYQAHYWGNLQWRVRHIDWTARRIWFGEGGQQMGAKWYEDPCIVNEKSHFFIENVFEELDAPGEWYLNREDGVLYLMPEPGVDLQDALIEVPVLKRLVSFNSCRHVSLSGFRFAHTVSTFLEAYEIPSLGDWAIHRSGAVTLEGSRSCSLTNSWFDAVGGNAVFISNFNRNALVSGCTFSDIGDSAVCLVGSFEKTVGSQKAFPYECRVENNRITRCGVFGKQVAGVYISRAKRITAGHNLIYNMPRAGICIGDGTWGGHLIEYNHIHDTCLETGDHGPFNAWGRDCGWCLTQGHGEHTKQNSHDAEIMLVDAMEPVVLRNNFFVEHAGWGLDLDDGASNYEIYNNICVGVSMKLREGCHRTIYNNIWINGANSPCFHIGNENNHDRYFRNITVACSTRSKAEEDLNFSMGTIGGEIYTLICPPAHSPWLEEADYNCFYSDIGKFIARVRPRGGNKQIYNLEQWQALNLDRHSVFADPLFIDPANEDYRVKPESPALKLGFENFEMGQWGLSDDFPESWWD